MEQSIIHYIETFAFNIYIYILRRQIVYNLIEYEEEIVFVSSNREVTFILVFYSE